MVAIELLMLVVCIGFPLAYTWRVLRLDVPTKAEWLLHVADAAVFVALVLVVGRWDMAGYYMRYAIIAAFVIAVAWSFWRHRRLLFFDKVRPALRSNWTKMVSLAFFGAALGYVVYGALPPEDAVKLRFPLDGGRFIVGQGGRIGLLNYHSRHKAQHHAADIVGLNAYGYRASGIAPKELEAYAVFGARVASPCAGTIVAVMDGLPDLTPPDSASHNAAGNHVVIDCGGFHVELAHLRKGSVAVAAGDLVAEGALLGNVGNSGNTTEPHLHVHAVDPATLEGVPISF
jgi:hypothetical protein